MTDMKNCTLVISGILDILSPHDSGVTSGVVQKSGGRLMCNQAGRIQKQGGGASGRGALQSVARKVLTWRLVPLCSRQYLPYWALRPPGGTREAFRRRAPPKLSVSVSLPCFWMATDIELLSMVGRLYHGTARAAGRAGRAADLSSISTMLFFQGQLDAAWICDDPYVQSQNKTGLTGRASLHHHKPLYQDYVIVNEGSTAQSFDEIRDTVHAFSDPDGASGYLVTRWMLALRQQHLRVFSGSRCSTSGHRNVIRAVGAGLAQSGSMDGYVWEVMTEREPSAFRKTRVVFKSEWLGFPPIVAPMAIRDAPAVKALAAALLDMPSDPLGRDGLRVLALDGFTTGTPDMY